MKFVKLVKASDWKVEKISETDWVIKSPDGTYKNSDGKDYHFKTKEDALEELDYLRAENKFDKKSKLGFFAKPENEKEELVLKISNEMANASWKEYQKNNWKGWSDEEERKQGLELAKKAIAPLVQKYKEELKDPELFKMLYEHNEDNNYHEENVVIKELLKSASLKNKFDKTAKSSYGDYLGALDDDAVGNYNIYQDYYGEIFITKHKFNKNYDLMNTADTLEEAYKIVERDWQNATAILYDKELLPEYQEKIFDFDIEIDPDVENEEEALENYGFYDLTDKYAENFDKSSSLKRKATKENVDGVSVTVYDHGKSGKAYSVEGLTYDECDKVYTELQNMYDIVDTKNMQQDEIKDKCHGYILCKNTINASKEVTARINDYEDLYNTLVNGNITEYKEQLNKLSKKELIDYIDWAEEMGIDKSKLSLRYITSSINRKAGYSGGWYVAPWEADEKLQLWIEVVGAEAALDDLASAMGPDELSENLAYIFRMNDFREGLSNDEDEE